jgi:hypothetical protein
MPGFKIPLEWLLVQFGMGQSVLNLQVSEELLTPYLALMSAFYSCILRLWSNFNMVLILVLFPDLQF